MELDNNRTPCDHREDQPEYLRSPTTGSLPVVEANNAAKDPPSSTDLCPEASPEPMVVEPQTNPLDPAPDTEEEGIAKKLEPPQQFQTVVEVRRRRIRCVQSLTAYKIAAGCG